MPKNLSSTGLLFPTQTSPVAGEPRTAGSLETPLQNASDRSQFLYDRLLYIDPDKGGARRVRRFASLVAMKGSSDHPDGTIAFVDGIGMYQYIAASELVEASPVVITPTDVGVGAGRWIHAIWGALNAANGVPQLDASGKLPTATLAAANGAGKIAAANVAYGTIQLVTSYISATFNVPHDSVEREVTGCDVSLSGLEVGDVILIDYDPVIVANGSSEVVKVRLAVEKPDTNLDYGQYTTVQNTPLVGTRARVGHHFTVSAAGTHRVLLGATGDGANVGTDSVSKVLIRVDVKRP